MSSTRAPGRSGPPATHHPSSETLPEGHEEEDVLLWRRYLVPLGAIVGWVVVAIVAVGWGIAWSRLVPESIPLAR